MSVTPTEPMLSLPLPHPEDPIPSIEEVHDVFHELFRRGVILNRPPLTASQNALQAVFRGHARLLTYMETHSRPKADLQRATANEDSDSEPPCFSTFRVRCESAIAAVQSNLQSPPQQWQRDTDSFSSDVSSLQASSASLTEELLPCVCLLIEALGWILRGSSTSPGEPQRYLSSLQHQLRALAAHSMSLFSSNPTVLSSSVEAHAAVGSWLHQANTALYTLSHFVSGTYPHGPWFAHRDRRVVMRGCRVHHPSDVGEVPFEALVDAASRFREGGLSALSQVVLCVAQAHTQSLSVIRTTSERPRDQSIRASIFAPLNTALNQLTATCEDLMSSCEDIRRLARAVIEASDIFTWLASDLPPCVVVEEAFGSANVHLDTIIARGQMLVLQCQQQQSSCPVGQLERAKAILTWAAILREALQKVVLMVLYRYPKKVPWGESLKSTVS